MSDMTLQKKRRLELHSTFVSIIGVANQSHVYYNPPEGFKLSYPAIVYQPTTIKKKFGCNRTYKLDTGYVVTVITKEPDSVIVQKIAELPTCSFDRHIISDNLIHDIFTIY